MRAPLRLGLPVALLLSVGGSPRRASPLESGAGVEAHALPDSAVAASAAGSLRPPPRPARRAESGEVLFSEDFRSLAAWRADRDGVWSVADGVLCAHLPDEKQERSLLYAGSEDWQDYAVDLDVRQLRGVDKGVAVRIHGGRGIGVDLRGGEYQDVLVYRQSMALGRAPAPNADRVWHHLRVEARGNRYRILVDGRQVLDCRDPMEADRRGRFALVAYTGGQGECSVQYAHVVVTKLE